MPTVPTAKGATVHHIKRKLANNKTWFKTDIHNFQTREIRLKKIIFTLISFYRQYNYNFTGDLYVVEPLLRHSNTKVPTPRSDPH